jgi:predicted RNase H-like nuclease (RuvC/YqgF family)
MSDIQKRNAAAMMQTLEKLREQNDVLRGRIIVVERNVAMLQARCDKLEERVTLVLASRGGGPTART